MKMKRNVLKSALTLLCAALFAVSFSACSNDPDTPVNENDKKLHEDPAKVTIELVECHMHGSWNKIETNGGPHQNPESKAKYLKRIQEITYEVKPGKGWTLAEGSRDKFYVIKAEDYGKPGDPNPAPIYLMFIKYYNNKGELMNNQFVENGQDAIHQHFFTVTNIKSLLTEQPEADTETTNYIEYKYVDTTPWNETFHSGKAQLTGKTNPIGLKGAIRFLKDRVTMDLKIRLYHGYQGKKDAKSGTFSPFYKPSALQIQRGTWDININVPVVVYASRADEIAELDENMDFDKIPENSLSEGSNKFLQAIMKALGISWKEALMDYHKVYYTAGDTESGAIWL